MFRTTNSTVRLQSMDAMPTEPMDAMPTESMDAMPTESMDAMPTEPMADATEPMADATEPMADATEPMDAMPMDAMPTEPMDAMTTESMDAMTTEPMADATESMADATEPMADATEMEAITEADAMAALDAEFYNRLKKGLDDDVRNPMIQSIRKVLDKTVKKETRKNQEYENCEIQHCSGKTRRRRKKCLIKHCKQIPKRVEAYSNDFLSTLPAACQSNGELTMESPECERIVTEQMKSCMSHKTCSAENCKNENGTWAMQAIAFGNGCDETIMEDGNRKSLMFC